MSLYRSILAALAAVVIAMPVFADETGSTGSTDTTGTSTTESTAMQSADNSGATTSTTTSTTEEQTTTTTQTKISLNTANAKELAKVKGLNNSKAKAIVAWRKKHGDFKSWDALKEVKALKGLSSEQWKGLQDQLSLD